MHGVLHGGYHHSVGVPGIQRSGTLHLRKGIVRLSGSGARRYWAILRRASNWVWRLHGRETAQIGRLGRIPSPQLSSGDALSTVLRSIALH